MPNQRVSNSFRYAEGKVTSVLQAFDPLSPVKSSDQEDSEIAVSTHQMTSIWASTTITSTSTPGSIWSTPKPADGTATLISPDQGICSPGADMAGHPGDRPTIKRDRDSGVPATPGEIAHADLLSEAVATGLKLTDQQNTNIDANRLSATILLFDPLMQESSTDDLDGDGGAQQRPLSEVLPERRSSNPFNRMSYQEGGARPKVPQMNNTSTPRISFPVSGTSVVLTCTYHGETGLALGSYDFKFHICEI